MANHAMVKLREYQNFDSVKEMDTAIHYHNKSLSKTHYQTLSLLARYSCKYPGVSCMRAVFIAKELGRSVRSVQRSIKLLKDKGIITIVNTFRPKGGKGSNAYIINTVDQRKALLRKKVTYRKMTYRKDEKKLNQTQSVQAFDYVKTKKKTIYSLKLLNSILCSTTRKYKRMRKKLRLEKIDNIKHATFDNRIVPEMIYKRFAPFFTEKELSSLYKVATESLEMFNLDSNTQLDVIEYGIESLVKALKRYYRGEGAPVYNMFAYLKRTLFFIGHNTETRGDIYAYTDASKYREYLI